MSLINKPGQITILGGGLAGLAVGYYAKKKGSPFTIYEAGNQIGGNCVTIKHGDFLFDSGAHRFHDKDAEVTKEIKMLLGEDLAKVERPSHIFDNGRLARVASCEIEPHCADGWIFGPRDSVSEVLLSM